MRSPTRQKLIDTGLKRFYNDGFRNTGLDQIIADVGITKTAFYKHFSCKEELMIEVLQQRAAWMQTRLRELLREFGGKSAAGQLEAVIDAVEHIIENPHSADFRGCIFVNASMEFPLLHEPAHQAAIRNQDALNEILREIAERAGARNAEALAEELVLILDGTYVTRQVTGSRAASFETARRIVRGTLAAHGVKTARTRGAGLRAAT